jgi:hypothetical protein
MTVNLAEYTIKLASDEQREQHTRAAFHHPRAMGSHSRSVDLLDDFPHQKCCRVLRPRSENWLDIYNTEPVGIRLPAEEGGEDAIVLFACSMGKIGKALLVTYIHNLDIGRLPILLEALDEAGSKAGVEEGWVWGISPESELGKAWSGQDGRDIKGGRRDEIDGHLLGVAWYGPQQERGVMLDTQMWNWC